MRVAGIVSHHKRKPFQAFRVCLSDGSSYEVREPELMYVTATTVVIGQPPLIDGVPERAVYCDPLRITRIVPVVNGKPNYPDSRSP